MQDDRHTMEIIKTILGTFDGQNMVGEDNEIYPIPSNYASKSRLVEGDTLKLYVYKDGALIYKQINLAPRVRFIGVVIESPGSIPIIRNPDTDTDYHVLYSSILFFKLRHGDKVAVLSSSDGKWAAVDTVVQRANDEDKELEK